MIGVQPFVVILLHSDQPTAYLDTALGDGDQEVIKLALRNVVDAQETIQVDEELRFNPDGWLRFQALMARTQESITAGKTLSRDDLWAGVSECGEMPSTAPRLRMPKI